MSGQKTKRQRVLRSQWVAPSEQNSADIFRGFNLRWAAPSFISVLLKNELIIFNAQGKPSSANGLLSAQTFSIYSTDKPQSGSEPSATQKDNPKSNPTASHGGNFGSGTGNQSTLEISSSGKYTFRVQKCNVHHLLHHEWSPDGLVTKNPTKHILASQAVIALLYGSGKLSLCYVVDNAGHKGVEEHSILDNLPLRHLNTFTIKDSQPASIAWRSKRRNKRGYLAVGGIGTAPEVEPCIAIVQLDIDGEVRPFGGTPLDKDLNHPITSIFWPAGAKEDEDLLFSGHANNEIQVWKVQFTRAKVCLVALHRIGAFSGFSIAYIAGTEDTNAETNQLSHYISAVSGNTAKTFLVNENSAVDKGKVVRRSNITGLAYLPKADNNGEKILVALEATGDLSCWTIQGEEDDAEWLPTTLATKWREADPNKLTFDPSLCTFPSYGLAVSPNAALVVTSHVQLHMRDVKGGSKGAKPSCVISVHATNLPWEVITASELNLNDVGWRIEHDFTDDVSSFNHASNCAELMKTVSAEDDSKRRMLCALGCLDLSCPADLRMDLDVWRRRSQLLLHMKHVISLLKTLNDSFNLNEEEIVCVLLCCDLLCVWAKEESCREILDSVWDPKDRVAEVVVVYRRFQEESVKLIDSPDALPCRERSLHAAPEDPPDGRVFVQVPENELGLIGKGGVSGEYRFGRCQQSLLCIKGGDDCLVCPTCDTTCLLQTRIRALAKTHSERHCMLCASQLVCTSYVSLVLNKEPATTHFLDMDNMLT